MSNVSSLSQVIGMFLVPADCDNMRYERHAEGSVSGVDMRTGNTIEVMTPTEAETEFSGAVLRLA